MRTEGLASRHRGRKSRERGFASPLTRLIMSRPKSRSRRLKWVGAGLALVILLFVFISEKGVPSIQGRSLPRLLEDLKTAYAEGRNADANAARLKLQTSGRDGMKWLATHLEAHEGMVSRINRRLWPNLPAIMKNRLRTPTVPKELDRDISSILASFGPPAAPYFTNYLNESKYALATRQQAYASLAETGNTTRVVLDILEAKIQGTNLADRVFAASAYAHLEPTFKDEAASLLIDVLLTKTNATSNERLWAANYLAFLGSGGTNAIVALNRAAGDSDPYVQKMAAKSLRSLTNRLDRTEW